ncbi:MAG: maleylpyruvate isomerase family mycothiol-dependent enzyme [Micromonosporaceae bacterium]
MTAMVKPDLMALATQERTELAEFLATLSPEQWDAPTLCSEWRVRDVVAHMFSYEELDRRGTFLRFAKGWFWPGRVNQVGVEEYATRTPRELLTLVRANLRPRGLTAGFGGMIALVDGTIHHQDIRRPLGMPREIPAERLLPVLRLVFRAPQTRAFGRARGLRLVATNLDFTHGAGPEVRGPAESILMAITGRHGVVDELSGPGQPTLAFRIT